MWVFRLSKPANDATFDTLGSAQRYMSVFVPETMQESRETKNEKEKVDDYYIKGEQVLSPFGDGNWDAKIYMMMDDYYVKEEIG